MATLETVLEKKLVDWAKAQNGVALKGATQFDTGYPDRLVYIPGAHAHAEIKGTSTRYHLNDKQKVWAGRIIASKVPYYIIESETQLEEFKEKIFYDSAIHSVGMYSLNGFNLWLYVNEPAGTYEIRSTKGGVERRISSALMSDTLANTIYRIFVMFEERYPDTNYCDI
jgi:hypothetical protein